MGGTRAAERVATVTAPPLEPETAFARRFAAAQGHPVRALTAMAHPAGLRDTTRYVRGLPVVTVALADCGPGAQIRAVLARRTLGIPTGRLAQAVLVLPDTVAGYLAGRHRQALRTNIHHVERLGITASRALDKASYLEAVERVLARRSMPDGAIATLTERHRVTDGWTYLAHSAAGVPLAFASWTVDARCALLRVQMSAWAGQESGFARYALHLALVRDLTAAHVTCLLAGSALTLDAGHRYYQSLLGFQVANLRLTPLHRAARSGSLPPSTVPGERTVAVGSVTG